jgi:hypothetical protein
VLVAGCCECSDEPSGSGATELLLHKLLVIKDDMDRPCSIYGRNAYALVVANIKTRNNKVNLGVDMRVILKWILHGRGVTVLTRQNWLKTGSKGHFSGHRMKL